MKKIFFVMLLIVIILSSCTTPVEFSGQADVNGTKYLFSGVVEMVTDTPAITQTFTPTFTQTFTPTLTPDFTPTFTFTPTLTQTFTPTLTFTPTSTKTPTSVSTFTATATSVPTTFPTPTLLPTGNSFLVGWWEDQNPSTWATNMATYAAQGQTMFILDGGYCTSSQIPKFKAMVKEAARYGMKVIVYLRCNDNTTAGITDADFLAVINALNDPNTYTPYQSSLYMWMLGDEPEFTSDAAVRSRRAQRLLYSYNLLKTVDQVHPVATSFDFNSFAASRQWQLEFYPGVDIIGMHQYPFYYNTSNLSSGTMIYDVWNMWKLLVQHGTTYGKGILASGQGFGEGWQSMRYPSYAELRFQMYAAIVQGAPSYLWWMDTANNVSGSSNPSLVPGYVGQLMTELKTANVTDIQNSPQMQSGMVVYRQVGNTIVAVNISSTTASVSIPTTSIAAQVLNENRTIQVNNQSLTDTFSKFQVHIYILR